MIDSFWAFLKDPSNRDILAWLGGGIVVVAGGAWAIVKFAFGKKSDGAAPAVQAKDHSVAIGGSNVNSPINTDKSNSPKR